MDTSTATALVTGADRGPGRALAQEPVARGATVHGAARRPDQIDLPVRGPVDCIASGSVKTVVDDLSRQVQADLSGGVATRYPQLG